MNQINLKYAPQNVEVEQSLLGALIANNRNMEKVSGRLKVEHFYDPFHGRMFETISRMIERDGVVVTALTLTNEMRADPGLKTLDVDYFGLLEANAPIITDLRNLADILIELSTRRSIIWLAEDMNSGAYEPPDVLTSKDLIERSERTLYQLADAATFGKGPMEFTEALRLAVENAEKAQARGGRISGVTTGFADIDDLLGGLQPSDLIILAGRPGMGKTALGTNMAFHAARIWMGDVEAGTEVPRGSPALFFSLEMAAQQLSARILSEQTEIEMWKIRNGRFSDSEWEKFVLTMQDLTKLPLYIDDTGGISIAQIAARARRLKREKNIGLIIVDYLQLIEPSRRHDNRVQEITEVTKGLKTLAKELNVPVLALSQLSRGVDAREDKRPVLSDLRESGSIEQDADVVMFVFREEYYLKSREPEPGTPDHTKWLEKMEKTHRRAEVMVEKHRHGATRRIDLFFDDRFTRFSNLVTE